MKYAFYSLLILLFFVVVSCQKTNDLVQPQTDDEFTGTDEEYNKSVPDACGKDRRIGIFSGSMRVGSIILYNNATNLYVHFMTYTADIRFTKTRLFVGNCEAKPTDVTQFPYQQNHNFARSYIYTIPLSQIGNCFCISTWVEAVRRDANRQVIDTRIGWLRGTAFTMGDATGTFVSHCANSCEAPCEIGHRTQTQGGWGAEPNGGNNGAYLHNNFASIGSVTIGNACGFTATFDNAQAITNFLPQGGPAQALGFNSTNPTSVTGGKQGNVFAGQVLTLAISVAFDNAIPSFSPSATPLTNLAVGDENSVFYGKTVGQILGWANQAIAGCATPYAISDLNSIVDAINNNFDDGTQNLGLLVCPKDIKK
jgi:hypothetical protein